MSASSTASSSLSRARTPILFLTVIAAAYGIYYLQSSSFEDGETPAGPGLHRSNAIHRRRRRNTQDITGSLLTDEDGVEHDEDAEVVARQPTDEETVVDDQAFQDDYSWDHVPPQRTGQNIVQLLFRVSEDATRRNAYVHRGCACNACGVVPIRGIRYRCANCADYDLCEGCESQGLHIKTHIFYKVRVPAPAFGPRNIQPVWYSGDPETTMRVLPKELISKLSRETGFERPELDAYWEQWTFMANTDWRDDPDDINLAMDRKTFERCLVPSGGNRAPSLIFDRMFAFYDRNKDDLISFPEFLHGLAYRKKRDKWSNIFDAYDIDGDGYVDRKDFLRIFRSYYALHRQMHRDMLEGLGEQHMSSTDTHRLVSSRQPLSSAFGQDGRYPPAPDPRTGEGKTVLPNGDLEISDGKGVINESGDDTGNREDVFRRNLLSRNRWDRSGAGRGYWDAILNPPVSVEQMPEVLRNLNRVQNSVTYVLNEHPNAHPIFGMAAQEEDHDGSASDSEDLENDENWPPRFVTVTDEDAEAVDGPGTTVSNVSRSSRQAVVEHAVQRARAHREIYERWRRRQFYTDEEEGALPPADWKEDDDVLNEDDSGESSKNPPPSRPRLHSRSSSKVRFVEEVDDFDTRSNPSTSSRSVPERWGGIEIPDAEKDAGKEILYQVTQQAFNELLDPLFKKKEDMALLAAETKSERDTWRHLFSTAEFEQWARAQDAEEAKKEEDRQPRSSPAERRTDNPVWPFFQEVDVEQVRERPLEDLLAATGYQIAPDPFSSSFSNPAQQNSSASAPPPPAVPEPIPSPVPETAQEEEEVHDPTLPQFRPSTSTTTSPTSPHLTSTTARPPPPPNTYLLTLWRAERAYLEKEVRGGWARLDKDEFLNAVGKGVREGRAGSMEYLGSWIEFCLP
jgi:Ca2+-binding EF-hand superfamily protein